MSSRCPQRERTFFSGHQRLFDSPPERIKAEEESRARFLKKFELTIIVRFKLEMPVAQHMSDQNKQKNEKPKLSAARLSTCDLESLV